MLLPALPVLIFLYVTKWWLWHSNRAGAFALVLYIVALVMAWAYGVFVLVGWGNWNHPEYTASEYWLGPALWLLPVPIMSYALDCRFAGRKTHPCLRPFCRYLVEVALLFPAWSIMQMVLALWFGWYWI